MNIPYSCKHIDNAIEAAKQLNWLVQDLAEADDDAALRADALLYELMDELEKVRSINDQLRSELISAENQISNLETQIDSLEDEIHDLRSTIKAMEASYD